MLPIFANPVGLWVLLGVPAILAIHFLQQRARVARTSTWFLIEKLSPDSARGRTWERLRASRQLWLQLLAVILAAWVLAQPRWVRAESAQTVAIVLDASASMEAFRAPALAAAEREMNLAEGLAARTTWILLSTDPRQPPLYRGEERLAATAALAQWRPELGVHDHGPALRLARSLAGTTGRSLLITDQRTKVPPDQRATGVGRPIDNVGFAGASVARDENGVMSWRALVKNHSATAQSRGWHLEAGGTRSPEQTLELAAGALTEISARFPEGASDAKVVLAPDAFAADDRLPLVRPAPKPLSVAVTGTGEPAEFLRKIAASVDGVTVLAGGVPATLKLTELSPEQLAQEPRGGIFWPPADQRQQAALATDPVTPERDPLVATLNWQGWLGTGPHGFTAKPGDTTLLWQGRFPLVLVRPPTDEIAKLGVPARKLIFAFDWATSNASRLPATVLLVRRFLETERDAQRGPYAANFDGGALVPLTGVPLDGALTLEFQPTSDAPPETQAIPPVARAGLRAPGRTGFFNVKRDGETLVRGATQFADLRQGDFRAAAQFFAEVRSERETALERNTRADPFVPLWLVLLAAAVLGSWWSKASAPAGSSVENGSINRGREVRIGA